MYCAKQRALAPLVTAWLATLQDGMLMFFSPAFCASAVIPAGVISAVPTICCCLRLDVTVERPLTPITITDDAEHHEHQAGNKPTDFECFAHLKLPFLKGAL